jgi:hypothetical protein
LDSNKQPLRPLTGLKIRISNAGIIAPVMIWQEKILRTGITSFLRDDPIVFVLFKKKIDRGTTFIYKGDSIGKFCSFGFYKKYKTAPVRWAPLLYVYDCILGGFRNDLHDSSKRGSMRIHDRQRVLI